jgi:hypothetical protein
MVTQPAPLVATAVDALRDSDCMRRGALEDELGGVLQQQDRTRARRETVARRREVAAQNVCLVHPRVGEKSIGRLGIRPVLAGKRNAGAHAIAKLPEQFAETTAEPSVAEGARIDFAARPMFVAASVRAGKMRRSRNHRHPQQESKVPGNESQPIDRDRGAPRDAAHRVTGGGRPPPVPTERSVRISRTTLFGR